MLPKFFKKQSGMGLVEVMVAASILGGLSLVVMKLNENGIQGVTRTEKGMEIVDFDSEINSYLASKEGCTNSVAGAPLLTSFDSSAEQYAIPSVRDRSNVVKFTPGVAGDVRRNVRFRSAYLTAYNQPTPAGPGAGNAFLIKTYEFKLSAEKTITKSKQITVAITPDTATGTMLSECIIKATKSDSVWTVDTYGIYYNNQTVAIGKTAAVDVPYLLDVEGMVRTGWLGSQITGTTNSYNNMLGSVASTITGTTATQSNMIGGDTLSLVAGTNVVMIGGHTNLVNAPGSTSQNTVVMGGFSHNVTDGAADFADNGSNALIAGQYLTVQNSDSSALVAGESNTIRSSQNSLILGGNNNVLGRVGSNDYASYSAIIGGSSHILVGMNSLILGGYGNTVDVTYGSGHSVIAGSVNSKISGTGYGNGIVGGEKNMTSSYWTGILGGYGNTISQTVSGIVGGQYNTITTSAAGVIGGEYNIVTGTRGAIIGGIYNSVGNTNDVVIGGRYNVASGGDGSMILGGASNTVGVQRGVVVGGFSNTVAGFFDWADNGIFVGQKNILGGYNSAIIAGTSNQAAFGWNLAVLGGASNTITTSVVSGNNNSIILGGNTNLITGGSTTSNSSLVGGFYNTINSSHASSILGGYSNEIASSMTSVLLGGAGNKIFTGSHHAIIGGWGHSVGIASSYASGIIGGEGNRVGGTANYIFGGTSNMIDGGGWRHAILGGVANSITGAVFANDVIVGGAYNRITNGDYSVILGGSYNTVTTWIGVILGGNRMRSDHQGTVMMGGHHAGTAPVLTSTADNQMSARFGGGIRLCTDTSNCTGAGLQLAASASAWTVLSDKNSKKHIESINYEDMLSRISVLDVPIWRYKHQSDDSYRNIGPMAQDFYKLIAKDYNLESSSKRISQSDIANVALVGVKATEIRTSKLSKENKQLKKKLDEMQKQLDELKNQIELIMMNQKKAGSK